MKTASGIILLVFLYAGTGFSQQYPLRLFNEEQGLNSLSVMTIHQSQQGFVWIGTMSGIYRFDGSQFREITSGGSSMWYIMDILEDRSGTVWAASGLGLYRIEHDEAVQVLDTGFPSNGGFISLYESKNGDLWFGTSTQGGGILDGFDTVYSELLPRESIYRIRSHRESGKLFAGNSGLFHLPENADSLHVVLDRPEVRDMVYDRSGRIWAATFSGVFVLEDGNIIRHIHQDNGLPSNEVWRLHYGTNGLMYAATAGGLAEFHDDFTVNRIGEEMGLINPQLQAIETDREGNLLLGTSYSGMYMIYNRHFTHIPLTGPDKQTRVTGIKGDKNGHIWLTTWSDGVFVLDHHLQQIKHIYRDAGLPDDRVTSAIPFSDGSAFIGTRHNGLFFYQNGSVSRVNQPDGPLDVYIMHMIKTTSGTVWISAHNEGIFHYRNGSFTRPFAETELDGKITAAMLEVPDQETVWLALRNGGVARVTGNDVHIMGRANGLPDELVFNTEADDSGNLWIAHHSGLSIFDGHHFFDLSDGETNPLDGHFIMSLLSDHQSRMWIALTRGLMVYDNGHFSKFTRDDGLVSDRFEDTSTFRDQFGYLWFGTYNGVIRISPDMVDVNPEPPPLVIDRVYLMNRRIDETDQVTAAYNENFIRIGLRGISFTTPARLQYRYRLRGPDSEWFETSQPEIQLASLSPGEYLFEAQASNDGENWSSETVGIRLLVRAPFWQTWWFRISVLLVIVAIGWAAYSYRVKRLIEMERLRTRIASDLHDDVGSTLTRISLYSELLDQPVNPEKKKRYANDISSLSRSVLSTMSDIVWSIDSRNDTWGDLVDRMREFAAGTLQAADIEHTFQITNIPENEKLAVDLRQNLYLIFKEALNNATRHSEAKKITITLERTDHQIILEITDDGSGFSENSGNGNGLKNMKLRADRIGAKLSIRSNGGTSIRISCATN